MRINRIDLERFGHFTNRCIEFPASPLDFYVIYGDNEAGKSTLLRGISSLLFGVPAKTPDTHSCKSSELRVGATISDGNKTFTFRRRKGTTGTLLSPDDGQIPDSAIASFLRELDRDRFEQFFGLNHQRLRDGGDELLRGKGDVGSALFQAAGLLQLRILSERLHGEAKELFSPRSRTKVINCALDRYNDAKSQTRRLAISAASIKQKEAELDAAKQAHERLKEESDSLVRDLVRLRRIASNKPDIARLQELRRALSAMEDVPSMPASARRERDEAAAVVTDAAEQIQILRRNVDNRKGRIAGLQINEVLKAHANEIEELNGETNDYHRSVSDRPKRVSERDEAMRRAEAEWSAIWRDHPISGAGALRSAYSKKSEIFGLIKTHARLTAAFAEAQENARTAKEDRDRLQDELYKCSDPGDPATLIAAIEQAKCLGDTDQAAARLRSELDRLTAGAKRELRKLHGWVGTLEDLETVKVPLLKTTERYGFEFERIIATRKDSISRLEEITQRIGAKQSHADRLAVELGGVGESELLNLRNSRDHLWRLIRACAFDQTLSREEIQRQSGEATPIETNFGEKLRLADEIADLRFAKAKDVAIHDQLVKEIERDVAEKRRTAEALKSTEDEEQDLRHKWCQEWSALSSDPLSPSEMKEWMQSRQSILDRLDQAREKEAEIHLIEDRMATARRRILECLTSFPSAPSHRGDSLAILLKVADTFAKQTQDTRRQIDSIRRQLSLLAPEKHQAKQADFKARLADWEEKWSAVLDELLLPSNRTPEQVEDAIASLEKVFGHLREVEALQHRIKRIGENIDLFESRVSRLLTVTDPSLGRHTAEAAVMQLHSRLVESGKAETERDTLEQQNSTDEKAIAGQMERMRGAESVLNRLKERANCDSAQQLEEIIAASEQKAEKWGEYERIAEGLIERNAAADLTQIEAEAAEHELDTLHAAIALRENRHKDLQDEVFRAGGAHATLQSEFERLQGSDNSTVEAQKAEDALAQVRPAVGHYLRLQLASEILRRAIENYREKHQGPVLKRASELFASLTVGDYCGLTTAFDDNDKSILVAIRSNRGNVEISGLSDGTRDQLYLALRLAAIEQHVATVSPCPVVLDDVLINADNSRASATLGVLGNLAKLTQVLFFTHHRHLEELGRVAGAQIVELRSSVVTARG
jgi:uncharacterized protein YhaN